MSCRNRVSEIIYLGHDNTIALMLVNDDVPLADLSAITRAVLTINGTDFDSDSLGSSVIWWADSMTYQGNPVNVIKFKLGGQSIVAGEYTGCKLVTYDPDNANGVVWSEDIKVTVK